MTLSIKMPFAGSMLKTAAQLNFQRRTRDARVLFTLPHFDIDNERRFWREQQAETLEALKTELPLGAGCLFAFTVMDAINGGWLTGKSVSHLSILLTTLLLFANQYWLPSIKEPADVVAKRCAALLVLNLNGILLTNGNPAFYAHVWIGLLPIYFFIYGQIFMSAFETLTFGLSAMATLSLSASLIGLDTSALMPSITMLLLVNAFGFCSRCQSEIHARRLFQERRIAENKSEDKTLLLRQLSHNLRQPLQALSCYATILDSAAIEQPLEPLQHMLGKLNTTIDNLNNTFNHMLAIANLETGKQIPQPAAVEINNLLFALENQFAPQAAKRGLKLKVHRRTQPPYTVYSDACILSQIVSNLIDNAIKYTDQGWIVIRAVKIGGSRLKLHVCDSGIGIAEELHGEIFKEFFRSHRRETDSASQGLGIGLAYASKAVKHLPGHSLQISSRPQRGSDFQLCLPQADAAGKTSNTMQLNLCGSFVFIVDTDRQLLAAMTERLSAWGCLVQTATSVSEMLEAFVENLINPDLIITDFYLNGGETAHDIIDAVQTGCGSVPTLIHSIHAIPNINKAKLPGNAQLLRKPANPEVLMSVMAEMLRRSGASNAVNADMKPSLAF